jgi:HK97 family phage prohead protease
MSVNRSFSIRAELRTELHGDEFVISGYAALFNSPSKNLGGFTETITPGAFTRSLAAKAQVQFTFNHSQDFVLARTTNGTLELSQDSKGLRFRAQLNSKIQGHRDIWEACKSGLYTECSFAFMVGPDGQTWSPDGTQRTLLYVDLLDVSLVGIPAYSGTSASARNVDAAYFDAVRARLETMKADWARADRAHEILIRLSAEHRRRDDNDDDGPDEEDLFDEACRTLGLEYCDHDEDFVYAGDPEDDDEDNCLRFEYSLDKQGNPTIDEDSRSEVKHSLIHSERGRKILAERRVRRADAALKFRMEAAAGRR